MKIDVNELDYSKYIMPKGIAANEFKDIVCYSYSKVNKLSENEVFKRIELLGSYLELNKCDEMFNIKEHWMVGNMKSNYRWVLRNI